MAEISDILTTLLERTKQDKINWQTTADDYAFLAVFGKTSVMIREEDSEFDFTVVSKPLVLRILNPEGREIERLSSETLPGGNPTVTQLRELYSMARHMALGVDSQLDDLLKELQAGD